MILYLVFLIYKKLFFLMEEVVSVAILKECLYFNTGFFYQYFMFRLMKWSTPLESKYSFLESRIIFVLKNNYMDCLDWCTFNVTNDSMLEHTYWRFGSLII